MLVYSAVPSSADVWFGIGNVNRRMGKWMESLEAMKNALEFDPLSTTVRGELCAVAKNMRRFDEALEIADRGLTLFPHNLQLFYLKIMIHLYGEEDPELALAVLEVVPFEMRDSYLIALARYELYMNMRDYEEVLLAASAVRKSVDSPRGMALSYSLFGKAYRAMEETEQSRVWFDSARVCIQSLKENFLSGGGASLPIGPVLAGLGRKDEAIEVAREKATAITLSIDAVLGAVRLKELALTYAMVGEHNSAVDLLDTLLSIPSYVTVPILRHHPEWDPLRDHPRFQALIEKYEKKNGF